MHLGVLIIQICHCYRIVNMANCSIIVSLFLHIQTDCLLSQDNSRTSELMPALWDSQIRKSIAIAQEVFWASAVVFLVDTVSLVYYAYVGICTFKIQNVLSVTLESYVAVKLFIWDLSCGIMGNSTGPKMLWAREIPTHYPREAKT